MVKSMYNHLGDQWKKPDMSFKSPQQQRLIQWRHEENFLRVDKPLRIDRARSLGYKAKQGYIVVRTHVRRGGLRKPTIRSGRKPSAKGMTKITMAKSTQQKTLRLTGFPMHLMHEEYFVEKQVPAKRAEV